MLNLAPKQLPPAMRGDEFPQKPKLWMVLAAFWLPVAKSFVITLHTIQERRQHSSIVESVITCFENGSACIEPNAPKLCRNSIFPGISKHKIRDFDHAFASTNRHDSPPLTESSISDHQTNCHTRILMNVRQCRLVSTVKLFHRTTNSISVLALIGLDAVSAITRTAFLDSSARNRQFGFHCVFVAFNTLALFWLVAGISYLSSGFLN